MLKLIQTKYIKHLLMLTAFAFLLSYQQVAKTITSASDLLDIIYLKKVLILWVRKILSSFMQL